MRRSSKAGVIGGTGVGGVRCGCRKIRIGVRTGTAPGYVPALLWIGRGKLIDDLSRQLRIIEAKILTAGESEAGVISERTSRCAVFPRSEDEQILSRVKRDIREDPLAGVRWIVGQRPPKKADTGSAPVEQLDPITCVAIFINQSVKVFGHDFVEEDISH